MRKHRWPVLFGFIMTTFVAAVIGGAATASAVNDWYPLLRKPAWTPPAWVFGPAWTLLYAMMSVAAWRIWLRSPAPGTRTALSLFFSQLALNSLWSILFFGLRRPDLALAEIFLLWLLLAATQCAFWRLDRMAGLLWAPYLAWVTFAAALNAAIWWLNRGG